MSPWPSTQTMPSRASWMRPVRHDVGRAGGGSSRRCAGAARRRRRRRAAGGTVCGAAIEPVISAAHRVEPLGDFGDLAVRRFVGRIEARLQRGDFLVELRDRLLHRLAFFEAGDVGARGARESRRSPARRSRRRARPRTSPRRQAGRGACGAAADATRGSSASVAARAAAVSVGVDRRARPPARLDRRLGGGSIAGVGRRRNRRRFNVRQFAFGCRAAAASPDCRSSARCFVIWILGHWLVHQSLTTFGYQSVTNRLRGVTSAAVIQAAASKLQTRSDRQAVLRGQRLERDRRARADVLDHFGGSRARRGGRRCGDPCRARGRPGSRRRTDRRRR